MYRPTWLYLSSLARVSMSDRREDRLELQKLHEPGKRNLCGKHCSQAAVTQNKNQKPN